MVVAGFRGHGRRIRVLISVVLLLVDIAHFAVALTTVLAFGLSLTRCLAILLSLRRPLSVPAVPRVVSQLAAYLTGLAGLIVCWLLLRLARALLLRDLVSFGLATRQCQRVLCSRCRVPIP